MSGYINAALRRLVATRADGLCEYCLINEEDTFLAARWITSSVKSTVDKPTLTTWLTPVPFAIGPRAVIGSIVQQTGSFVRFFNPRTDQWAEHFVLDGVAIVARSDIGEVTARILDFNNEERLFERQTLQAIGRYPSAAAIVRMGREA
jgi:hypothetical protein